MRRFVTVWRTLPRGQQLFLVLLATFVGIPFAVLLILQVHNAYSLARLSSELASRHIQGDHPTAKLNARIAPESLKSPANRFAYELLEAHGDMVPERRLVLTIQQPLEESRSVPRKIVTEEDLRAAAGAHVSEIGESECDALVGTLAARCTVLSATGRPIGDNAYEYQLQLAFVERSPLGVIEPDAAYDFLLTRSEPGKAVTMKRVYFEKAAELRRSIYKDVAGTCARIRKKSGNCSITSLSVAAKLERGTLMVRLSASAAYASLVPAPEIAASAR